MQGKQSLLSGFLLWIILWRLFIAALGSPEGKGLTSLLLFVMFVCDIVSFPCVPGTGVVLDCIDY